MYFEPSILSNNWLILGVFVGSLIVAHLILVTWWPLTDIGWKKVDYLWLAVAGLTLFSATSTLRHNESRDAILFSQGYWSTLNQTILEVVHNDTHYTCDTHFIRGEYSPKNFDEVGREFSHACNWYRAASKTIEAELRKPEPNLRPDLIRNPTETTNPTLRQGLAVLFHFLAMQAEVNSRRVVWRSMAQDDDWDVFRTRVAPLMFAVALALRLTKVTGEIRLARNKLMAKTATVVQS